MLLLVGPELVPVFRVAVCVDEAWVLVDVEYEFAWGGHWEIVCVDVAPGGGELAHVPGSARLFPALCGGPAVRFGEEGGVVRVAGVAADALDVAGDGGVPASDSQYRVRVSFSPRLYGTFQVSDVDEGESKRTRARVLWLIQNTLHRTLGQTPVSTNRYCGWALWRTRFP